jgi:tetratricopeptide (TPR) repeat protein
VPTDANLQEALTAFQSGDLERARELAEEAFAASPSPQVEHLIGLVDCRAGRLESGIDWLRRASEASPGNAPFRVMLARALVDAGRADEALDVATAPGGGAPTDVAVWHARAEAAQAAKDHAAAAQAWHILCSVWPDDWRVWANYGEALAGLGRWEEAANALRRAWALNPGELQVRRNFAAALTRAGFYPETVDELRHMLESGPDDHRARIVLARLLADLGRYDESLQEFDRAARLAAGSSRQPDDVPMIRIALPDRSDPSQPVSADDVQALRELALLLERTNRMDELHGLLRDAESLGIARDQVGYPAAAIALRSGDPQQALRLLESESSSVDPIRWHALKARILDALGDPRGAFAAAAATRDSVDHFESWQRRSVDYRRRIRALANVITPEWASRLRPLEPADRKSPAFLVGFPRSGTTLLDTFLMGHPEVTVVEEQPMLRVAETVLGEVAHLPDCRPEQVEEARRAYFSELDHHVRPGETRLVIDKLPLNLLGLPVIYSLFPDARIIFAQRHPCDAVLSCFMQGFALNDAMACFLTIESSADLYDAALTLFTRSREILPVSARTLVYEELVAGPEEALTPLVEFLGLEWRPELLDHRSTAKARGAISTPSYGQIVEPINSKATGRWRRYQEQLASVLPVLLPWAEKLGYSK